MWFEVLGFNDLVREWWSSFEFEGFASFILAQKLKAPKKAIKNWNMGVLGRVEQRKADCLSKIAVIDVQEQSSSILKALKFEKENLRKAYHSWMRMEEISWKQKSRISWLKHRDNNTKFFHRTADHRKKENDILGLYNEERWVNGHAAVQEVT